MAIVIKLDLTEIPWPTCLFKLNKTLGEIRTGCDLVVLVQDPDIVGTIGMIVSNSSNRVVQIDRVADRFSVCIRKC